MSINFVFLIVLIALQITLHFCSLSLKISSFCDLKKSFRNDNTSKISKKKSNNFIFEHGGNKNSSVEYFCPAVYNTVSLFGEQNVGKSIIIGILGLIKEKYGVQCRFPLKSMMTNKKSKWSYSFKI